MTYIFNTSTYDVDALVPEVSQALEKRVELVSRQKLPGMWKATDRLSQGSASGEMPRGRLIYRRVVGIALIVLGLFMLIPGLMQPKELLTPLIAGICGLGVGIHSLWSTRKKPARKAQEEPTETPAKVPAEKSVTKLSKKYVDTAKSFLSNLANVEPTCIRFSEEGMELNEDTVIRYEEMECFVETPSGYLIAWGRTATYLQKKDLQLENKAEFGDFVAGRVPHA